MPARSSARLNGLRIPDYRIATTDGRQLMVEVKNCQHGDPQEPFEIKKEYCMDCAPMRPRSDADSSSHLLVKGEAVDASQRGGSQTTARAIDYHDDRSAPARRMHVLGDRLIGTVPF